MRILHFVTGGFSGATQVAIDLSLAALHTPGYEVMLVLRRKPSTDEARIEKLRQQGLQVHVVSNWMHLITVWELRKVIRSFKPDAVFAHGFSDHIWGRRAAVAENVPRIFHVEHNSRERYTARRLAQSQTLMPHTEACIGVSEGVRTSLLEHGFDPAKCIAIHNGIDLERFPESISKPWEQREPAIIMASRFARQKDHATLIRALAVLKEWGPTPTLYLAGGGKQRLRQKAQDLAAQLGLKQQVHFLGNVADLPQRLGATQIFVLATHWEGFGLATVEAMLAGCACIVSDVPGATEVFEPDESGILVPESDAQALATTLQQLLEKPEQAQKLGLAARKYALQHFGREHMWQQYQAILHPSV
ncbi:MAG: glycosyltransferase [Comamonas sp.]|jgi:glycosyltransferase involved in cell wall biosynthesis|uniref:glycosyltransferase n=1 Tax=Comamonas sp. TaxID=34028 RepID=UPI00282F5E72|nr:glycosyltransferase [Comamonas sp.]MDR0216527.1 glycosyltransferase [Comamonas sp.]